MTGPSSGPMSVAGLGGEAGSAGRRSASWPETVKRRTASSTSGPQSADTISAVGTEVQPARCPQVAAPAAEPPISAIW